MNVIHGQLFCARWMCTRIPSTLGGMAVSPSTTVECAFPHCGVVKVRPDLSCLYPFILSLSSSHCLHGWMGCVVEKSNNLEHRWCSAHQPEKKPKNQCQRGITWVILGFLLSTVSIPTKAPQTSSVSKRRHGMPWPLWNLPNTLASQTLGTFDVRPFPGPHLWQSAPPDRHSDQNTTGCSSRSPGSAAGMDLSSPQCFCWFI